MMLEEQDFVKYLIKASGAQTKQEFDDFIKQLGEDGLKKAYEEYKKLRVQSEKKGGYLRKLKKGKRMKKKC